MPKEQAAIKSGAVVHAFTVDVEDWFHIMDTPLMPHPDEYHELPSRVEQNTDKVLTVLAEHDVLATFFVLGWVAERYPRLVRRIHHAGHEIGVHGYHHVPAFDLSDKELSEDTKRGVAAIGDAIGEGPIGYRSPGGSLLARQKWLFDELLDMGVWFDSSVYPRPGGLAEAEGSPKAPYLMGTPSGRRIWEFPSVTKRWLAMDWAFSEGGYMRLLPSSLVLAWIREQEKRRGRAMVCIHPRELDPDQPRLELSAYKQWKTQVGIKRFTDKLNVVLRSYRFAPMGKVLSLIAEKTERGMGVI